MTYSDTCPPCGKVFSGEDREVLATAVMEHARDAHDMTCHASMCWPISTARTRTTLSSQNRRRHGARRCRVPYNPLTWAASRLNAGLAAGVGLTRTAVKPQRLISPGDRRRHPKLQ